MADERGGRALMPTVGDIMVPAAECLGETATLLEVAVCADQGGASPILVLSDGKCRQPRCSRCGVRDRGR